MADEKTDLTYVPIVGPGVDAIDRRDPAIMGKIYEQVRKIFVRSKPDVK